MIRKLVVAVALLTSTDASASFKLDSEATVEAHMQGPAGLEITAQSTSVVADDNGENLSFVIPVTSLKTGIGLRDSHMRKALDATTFSDIRLVIADSAIKLPPGEDVAEASVVGSLTLHGTTREVRVSYAAVVDCDNHVGVSAKFVIDMRDFGITPPSYMGLAVRPKVTVETKLRMQVTQ